MRNTLAINGSIDQHARVVQYRAAVEVGASNTGGFEPLQPVRAVIEVKKREFQQI